MTSKGFTVALTGVSGYLGRKILKRLEQDERVGAIIGIDIKNPPDQSDKLFFHPMDITDPRLAAIFKERAVTHVIHLAFVLDAVRDAAWATRIDIEGTRNVLESSVAVGVQRMIVASSSVVYGAWPDPRGSLLETAAMHPDQGLRYGADKVAVERLCESYQLKNPELHISTLRSVTIVGPGMTNFISRAFEKPVQILPRGFDPSWQFIHEDDCALAFHELLWSQTSGPFNLAADGVVRLSEVIQQLKKTVIRLPKIFIQTIAEIGWRLGLRGISEAPGVLVNYFCFPPILDTTKLKNTLKTPFRYTSAEAIADFISPKKIPGGDGK
jgi:UDP-glucose 4-epimerase